MDAAIVRQFLDFFQDFIHICQSQNWPDDNTDEVEIKNSLLIAKHIEKCINRLQQKDLFDEFLSTLSDNEDTICKSLLKISLSDPPKYVLKKIIKSKIDISKMDVSIKMFLEIFSAEKLENCLKEIMLEAASIDMLLKNLPLVVSKDKLLEFNSKLFLSELSSSDNCKDILKDMLNNPKQNTIDLLVVCLTNNEQCYDDAKKEISVSFVDKMITKSHDDKQFWEFLLNVEQKLFIAMCLKYADIFKLITNALIDCSKLLVQNMSTEFFYIDLTYSKLVLIVKGICNDCNLMIEFFDMVTEFNSEISFWECILQ